VYKGKYIQDSKKTGNNEKKNLNKEHISRKRNKRKIKRNNKRNGKKSY
jgi:hypothetical protein